MSPSISKLSPITTTCIEYVHPWTNNCWNATAGLLLRSAVESLRIYSAVYALSMLMRGRIPNWRDIKRTVMGIIQSSAFLTTSAFSYSMYLCILRNLMGHYNFFTVSYVPAFMSSLSAIIVERPSRRGLLCLYVANVATETLWRMGVSRRLVKPIKNGQVIIFGISCSILLYYFRKGLHLKQKDSLFDVLRFVIGKNEEYYQAPSIDNSQGVRNNSYDVSRNTNVTYFKLKLITYIINYLNMLKNGVKNLGRHKTCPHSDSCVSYMIAGGTKLFLVGLGIQMTLSLVLRISKIINNPRKLKDLLFNKDIKIALFLGGFCVIYRSTSCFLRQVTNIDSPLHAIPAGLLAGVAFAYYPDTSVALYIMWKMLQISYNIGVDKKWLPKIPGFKILLYCACTATLFHAATLEPTNLRPSYWKFLHSLSGGRIAGMDRKPLNAWGLETSRQLAEVLKRTNTNLNIEFTF